MCTFYTSFLLVEMFLLGHDPGAEVMETFSLWQDTLPLTAQNSCSARKSVRNVSREGAVDWLTLLHLLEENTRRTLSLAWYAPRWNVCAMRARLLAQACFPASGKQLPVSRNELTSLHHPTELLCLTDKKWVSATTWGKCVWPGWAEAVVWQEVR